MKTCVSPPIWEFLHTSAFIPFSFLYSFSAQTIASILLRLVLLPAGVAESTECSTWQSNSCQLRSSSLAVNRSTSTREIWRYGEKGGAQKFQRFRCQIHWIGLRNGGPIGSHLRFMIGGYGEPTKLPWHRNCSSQSAAHTSCFQRHNHEKENISPIPNHISVDISPKPNHRTPCPSTMTT